MNCQAAPNLHPAACRSEMPCLLLHPPNLRPVEERGDAWLKAMLSLRSPGLGNAHVHLEPSHKPSKTSDNQPAPPTAQPRTVALRQTLSVYPRQPQFQRLLNVPADYNEDDHEATVDTKIYFDRIAPDSLAGIEIKLRVPRPQTRGMDIGVFVAESTRQRSVLEAIEDDVLSLVQSVNTKMARNPTPTDLNGLPCGMESFGRHLPPLSTPAGPDGRYEDSTSMEKTAEDGLRRAGRRGLNRTIRKSREETMLSTVAPTTKSRSQRKYRTQYKDKLYKIWRRIWWRPG
ncbi:hypothetical protein P154DRAFT_568436 [Amniculicola lignicola CBS 123094]|uniref:Uncharacterized protein n=1 Tax=Amniculicola lignicola CBS 123094 TaxID=1392246 RepID=A0A6A5VV03_9PLEO|nr:hypothetical protein P154DRAFT_568436 [Amniculicola lignicola CBS 123094]